MEAREGSPEEAELEVLAILVEHYDREAFPLEAPSPELAPSIARGQAPVSYMASERKLRRLGRGGRAQPRVVPMRWVAALIVGLVVLALGAVVALFVK